MNLDRPGLLARLRPGGAATNFGWLSLDRLSRLAVGLVLGVWMARALGPADYGRLNFALSAAAILAVIPTLGLDSVLRRELVRRPADAGALLGTAFVLRAVSSVVCYAALAAGTVTHLVGTAPAAVMLVLGVTVLQPALQTTDLWFHAALRARTVVVAQQGAFLLASAARATVLLVHADLTWLAVTLVIDVPVSAVLVLLAYRRSGQRLGAWAFDRPLARALLREAAPLVLSSLAVLIYHRIDQIMLPSLAGTAEAGQYAAAVRVVELWYFIPMGLAASWAPALVRAHGGGEREFDLTIRRQFRIQAAIAWAATVGTGVAAPWLLPLLYGSDYAHAGNVAAVLVFSLPFVALGVARGEAWIAAGLGRFSLPAAALGAVTNVLLNLWWMPRWGALGAAAATLLSYALAAVGATFCWRAVRPLGFRQLDALALRGLLWDRASRP